jgi:flagellar protein FliS
MSFSSQSSSYREMEILSASADRLLVIVFDQLIVNLERARLAMERGNVELRVMSLRRARDLVNELLVTLDFDGGGQIAAQLADLYQFMLLQLVDVGQRGDIDTVRKLTRIASHLRDGFAGALEQSLAVQRSA